MKMFRLKNYLLLFIIAFCLCFGFTASAFAADSVTNWTVLNSSTSGYVGLTGHTDGKLYAYKSKYVYYFDTNSNTWVQVSSNSCSESLMNVKGTSYNGELYFAGFVNAGNYHRVYKYNLSTNTWTNVSSGLPSGGTVYTPIHIDVLNDGSLYYCYYYYTSTGEHRFAVYKFNGSSWSQSATYNTGQFYGGYGGIAGSAINNKIYIIGGVRSDSEGEVTGYTGTAKYESGSISFITAINGGNPNRGNAAAGMVGSKLFIAGGYGPTSPFTADTLKYDTNTNTWSVQFSSGASWRADLMSASTGAVVGNKLYANTFNGGSTYALYCLTYTMGAPMITNTSGTPNSITVNWTDNSENETQFRVFLNGVSQGTIPSSTQSGTGGTYSYTISGLTPGTNYTVGVQAEYVDGIYGIRNFNSSCTQQAALTAPGNVTVTGTSGGLSWSNSAGRGYVTLSWPAVPTAMGYKLHVFDGNAYREFDLGNVTSWDSRTAKIYPAESTLDSCGNNTQSGDLFNHVQGGYDLRDTPNKLYLKTIGTTYDSYNNYWFRVGAYNSAGESDWNASTALYQPTLPNRTDTSQPLSSGLTINDGAANAGSRTVTLFVTANDPIVSNYTGSDTDDYSGLSKVQISNDNFTSYQEYNWPIQGQQSGSATFSWTLVAGDGSKTVYIRPVDQAGNIGPTRTASIYLVNDVAPPSVSITLNGGSSNVSTDSRYNLLGITANDNLTPPDQLQYRTKVGSGSFSSWAPYTATVSNFDIGTVGGSLGISVEVKDANGNIGSATMLIYYNTTDTRPAATNTTPTVTATSWGANLDGQVISLGGVNMKVVQGDTVSIPITGISNATQLLVSFDGVNWSTPDSIPSGTSTIDKVVTFSGEGTKAVYFKTKNSYGAESQVYTRYYLVDKTAPEIIEVKTANGARATSGSTIQLVISAKDNISRQLGYRINGSAWATLPSDGVVTATLPSNGINVLKIEVVDQAGNVASRVISVRKIAILDTYAMEYQNAA